MDLDVETLRLWKAWDGTSRNGTRRVCPSSVILTRVVLISRICLDFMHFNYCRSLSYGSWTGTRTDVSGRLTKT